MPTEIIYVGAKFEVRSWVENGTNVVLEFLEQLQAKGDSDAVRLNNLIMQTADNGVRFNERHIRFLGDGLYEFKAPNTGRIIFFYDKNRLIICSHGFTGKKGNEDRFIKKQIKKAAAVMTDYRREKGE